MARPLRSRLGVTLTVLLLALFALAADGECTTTPPPTDTSAEQLPALAPAPEAPAPPAPVEPTPATEPAPADPPEPAVEGFTIEGTGNDVQAVTAYGRLTCRAEVRDNFDPNFGNPTNFQVTIHGGREFNLALLANLITATGSDADVVTFGGDGLFALVPPYRVEVNAVGDWIVTCG